MPKKTIYLCPKCGSTNCKLASPIKSSDIFRINTDELVNNVLECRNCGYLGIFYVVDKDKVKEVQKQFKR